MVRSGKEADLVVVMVAAVTRRETIDTGETLYNGNSILNSEFIFQIV